MEIDSTLNRWHLVFVSEQLLQIFCKTDHDHNRRPCHSNKEQWHNDSGNHVDQKFHTD